MEVVKINFDFANLPDSSNVIIEVPGFSNSQKVISIGKNVFNNLYENKDKIKNITWLFHKNNVILESNKIFYKSEIDTQTFKHTAFETFTYFFNGVLVNYVCNLTEINPIIVLNNKLKANDLCTFEDDKIRVDVLFKINNTIYARNRFNYYIPINKNIKVKDYYPPIKKHITRKSKRDKLNYNLLLNKNMHDGSYYNKNDFRQLSLIGIGNVTDENFCVLDVANEKTLQGLIEHFPKYKYNNIITSDYGFSFWNLTKKQIKALKIHIKDVKTEYEMLIACIKFCIGKYDWKNNGANDKEISNYLNSKIGVCRHMTYALARVLQICGFVNKTITCWNNVEKNGCVCGHIFNSIYLKSLNKWVYLDLTIMQDFQEDKLNKYFQDIFNIFYNSNYVGFLVDSILIPANINYFNYFENKDDAFFHLGNEIWSSTITKDFNADNKNPFLYGDEKFFSNYILRQRISLINSNITSREVAFLNTNTNQTSFFNKKSL